MTRFKGGSLGRCAGGAVPLAAVLCMLAGCSPKPPPRYDLSGKVTYQGAPVPRGYIVFRPDVDNDKDVPVGAAPIVNGAYKTPPGLGTIGGSLVATIVGFDGVLDKNIRRPNPLGSVLFPPIQVKVDLPRQDSTHDFVLPIE